MAKVTAKHFALFKQECEKWIDKLSLRGWFVDYEHKKLDEKYAETRTKLTGRIAVIALTTEWYDKTRPLTDAAIAQTAKHEVIHLLLSRVFTCGISRYISESEIEEAEEEVVRTLEQTL